MKIEINNKFYNIPSSVGELTWKQLKNLMRLKQFDFLSILSAILNESPEFIGELSVSDIDFMALNNELKWIETTDFNSFDRRVISGSKLTLATKIDIDLDFSTFVKFGQFISILSALEGKENLDARDLILNTLVGNQLAGEEWKGQEDYQNLIDAQMAIDMFPVSTFFLKSLKQRTETGRQYKPSNLRQLVTTSVQVFKSLRNLVSGRQ